MAVSHAGDAGGVSSVTLPTVRTNDLLWVSVYSDDNTATCATPTGWTALTKDSGVSGSLFYFYRWATASLSGTTHTFSPSAGRTAVVCDVLRGAQNPAPTSSVTMQGGINDVVSGTDYHYQWYGTIFDTAGGMLLAVCGWASSAGATVNAGISPLTLGGSIVTGAGAGLATAWYVASTDGSIGGDFGVDVTIPSADGNDGLQRVFQFDAGPVGGTPPLRQIRRNDGVRQYAKNNPTSEQGSLRRIFGTYI